MLGGNIRFLLWYLDKVDRNWRFSTLFGLSVWTLLYHRVSDLPNTGLDVMHPVLCTGGKRGLLHVGDENITYDVGDASTT